jgi:ketosteroid isomerase-like protein
MSDENVQVVREVMDLLDRAGMGGEPPPRLTALFASDVRIDMSRRVFNPDVYEGYAGLRRLGHEIADVWDEFRLTPERFIDAGDRVVVIETRRGRGRGSGVEVEHRSAVIWTVRDGQVIRMETDLDPEQALEAVGLRE